MGMTLRAGRALGMFLVSRLNRVCVNGGSNSN